MPSDLQNACDVLHQLDFDDGKTLVARGCSFSIGRSDCNDLVNLSAHLSAKHCRLEPTVSSVASGDGGTDGGLECGAVAPTLIDTSSNGTFVGGAKVHRAARELKWGEKVEVVKGNTVRLSA